MDGRQNYAWVHGPKRLRKQTKKQPKLYSSCRSSRSIVVVVMVAPRLVFGGRGESSLLIYVFGESCQEQKERQRGQRILFQHFNNTQQPPRKSTGQLLVPRSRMLLRDYTERCEPTWRLRGRDREILSWNRRLVVGFLDVESFKGSCSPWGLLPLCVLFISLVSTSGRLVSINYYTFAEKHPYFIISVLGFFILFGVFFLSFKDVPFQLRLLQNEPTICSRGIYINPIFKKELSYFLLGLFVAFDLFLFLNERLCLIAFKCDYLVQISAAQRGSSLIGSVAQTQQRNPGNQVECVMR